MLGWRNKSENRGEHSTSYFVYEVYDAPYIVRCITKCTIFSLFLVSFVWCCPTNNAPLPLIECLSLVVMFIKKKMQMNLKNKIKSFTNVEPTH